MLSRTQRKIDFVCRARKKNHWNAIVRFWYRVILSAWGLQVNHILADGGLESHDSVIERFLEQLKLPSHDLFRTHQDVIQDAFRAQERAIAHVNQSDASSIVF